jgi:SHS2 domain-containing protein
MQSKPGQYEYLPHTADAKFRAYGASREECFRNAARAMVAIITDIDKVKGKKRIVVKVKATNREALLFDLLDQLLYLLDTENLLLHDLQDVTITEGKGGFSLTAIALGDHYKAYETHGDVKAVTYSDMKIEQLPDGKWWCQVVVDL